MGRGAPLGKDGIYVDGHTIPPNVDNLAKEFRMQKNALVTHLHVHREKGQINLNL